MEEVNKVSWGLAAKVAWSFAWRYLVWVILMSFVAGVVNGLLVKIVQIAVGFPSDHPLKALYIILSSLIIVVVLIVNMVRMMLNKREFNNFTLQPKR